MLSLALFLVCSPPTQPLHVLAYNVLLEGGRPKETVAVIARSDADVVLLQEVTPAWRDRIEASKLAKTYPHRRYLPRRGAYGFAILSRLPLSRASTIQVKGAEPSSLCALATLPLTTTTTTPKTTTPSRVAVCSLHLKSARSAFYEHKAHMTAKLEENARLRVHQWEHLLTWLGENADGIPQVIGGDANTPGFDTVLSTLTSQHKDAAAAFEFFPDATYPAIPKDALLHMRLDYIFVSPNIGVTSFDVVEEGGSDHHAVEAVLALPIFTDPG